jgi:ferrous iron transport protein B
MAEEFTIALAGNPNSGKSTIFNSLTGGRQHVGNWPGKTVEKKEGIWRHDGRDIKVVDLPGTYSLAAYSLEEVIARDYLVDERPQVVVDVVDAANLERNLYLAVQVLELGAHLVIALNMSDMADARGYKIDVAKLSEGLGGVPVVPTVGSRGQGIEELKEKIIQAAGSEPRR